MRGKLRLSARRHDARMAKYNAMTHKFPWEPYFGQRETNAGYIWCWAGENIGWTSDISQSGLLLLERLMYNEKPPGEIGHRLNILSSHFRDVGVDVWIDTVHNKLWFVQDFGSHCY